MEKQDRGVLPLAQIAEVIEPSEALDNTLVIKPAPFRTERTEVLVPKGRTIQQHVDAVLPPGMGAQAVVRVGGDVIDPAYWAQLKPKPGVIVHVDVMPTGGAKKIIRTVLTLALVVAAFYAGPAFAQALGFVEGMAGFAQVAAIGSALTVFAGQLLLNALIPPSMPKNETEESRITASGFQNEARQGRPVPVIFGKVRYYPPMGALPYAEVVGDDQYVRALFCFGYGPLELSDFRFGDTSIDEYEDVQIEVVRGFAGDDQPRMFTNDVTTNEHSLALEAGNAQTVTTADGTDEAEIDILFPEGLVRYSKKGQRQNQTVAFSVQWRESGAGAYKNPPDDWTNGVIESDVLWDATPGATNTRSFTDNTAQPKLVSIKLRFPTAARYDIRITRTTADFTDDSDRGSSTLNAVRSIKHSDPVRIDGMCMVAVRVRTTRQIKNELRRFNAIAQRLYPVYDAQTDIWTEPTAAMSPGQLDPHRTRSPAAAYAYVLRGRAASRTIADERIHMGSLSDWWTASDQNAPNEPPGTPYWTFDHIVEGDTTLFDIMKVIAASGRARPTVVDGRYGVVRDVAQDYPVQMFTPRNSRNLRGEFGYTDIPHVLNVHIGDEDRDFQEHVIAVYNDGDGMTYDENTATKQDRLDLPGVVRAGQAWREGRYHLAQAQLRPETYTFETDIEGIVCQAGDWIKLQHDVPNFGVGQGRVIGTPTTGSIQLDSEVTLEAGTSYIVRIRSADTSEANRFMDGTVTNGAGSHETLTISPPLSSAPLVGDLVAVGEASSITRDLVVKAIEPLSDLEWRIIALDRAPEVHTADTGPIPDFNPFASGTVEGAPGQVRNLRLTELIRFDSGVSRSYVGASWQPPGVKEVAYYEVYRQIPGGEWVILGTTEATQYEVPFQLQPGEEIIVAVVAVGIDDKRLPADDAAFASITVDGDPDAPDKVNNLDTLTVPFGVEVSWTNPTGEPDLKAVNIYAGVSTSRWSSSLVGTVDTNPNANGGYFVHNLGAAGVTRRYWAKPVDAAGNEGPWNATTGKIGTSGDVGSASYRQDVLPSSAADGEFGYDTDDRTLYRWNEATDQWEFVASYNDGALADKDTVDTLDIDNEAVAGFSGGDKADAGLSTIYTTFYSMTVNGAAIGDTVRVDVSGILRPTFGNGSYGDRTIVAYRVLRGSTIITGERNFPVLFDDTNPQGMDVPMVAIERNIPVANPTYTFQAVERENNVNLEIGDLAYTARIDKATGP